jgi:mRNA interferase MazF
MKKGFIVLLPFPFTNLSGFKNRPAVVLHTSELDCVVAFISTQLHWQENTDIVLQPNTINRLKKTSLIRVSKIATIENSLVMGKLGELNASELTQLDINLKLLFELK